MTVARPIIGADATRDAINGKYRRSAVKFVAALATDGEGTPARRLDATTKAGGIGDPIADGLLRAEFVVALAKKKPVTAGLLATAELYNLGLNLFKVQKGRKEAFVPNEAKAGTVIQAAGTIAVFEGLERDHSLIKLAGTAGLLAGTAMRTHAYWSEARRMKHATRKKDPLVK